MNYVKCPAWSLRTSRGVDHQSEKPKGVEDVSQPWPERPCSVRSSAGTVKELEGSLRGCSVVRGATLDPNRVGTCRSRQGFGFLFLEQREALEAFTPSGVICLMTLRGHSGCPVENEAGDRGRQGAQGGWRLRAAERRCGPLGSTGHGGKWADKR